MIYTAKPFIGEEEIKEVEKVLRSGMLAQGERVRKFEEEFSSYVECKYGIATSNGTSALDVMLRASDVEGEVIVPSFTFIATANSVSYQNLKPVFADVDVETFNITAEHINEKITSKTKAVIVLHLFGNPVEMDSIKEICEEKGIMIFEDSAQAHGSEYKGKKVGSLGLASSFSFYATKNMTTGEGGMITTNDEGIYKKAKIIVDQGQESKYKHTLLGHNFRMTEIAGALGLVQLKRLERFNEKRRENAEFLNKRIKAKGIILPKENENGKHVYHQYVIRVVEEDYGISREELIKRLKENGIAPAIHYPIPIHKQPIYDRGETLENSERLAKEVLSLPIHPLVEKEHLERIVRVINGEV